MERRTARGTQLRGKEGAAAKGFCDNVQSHAEREIHSAGVTNVDSVINYAALAITVQELCWIR